MSFTTEIFLGINDEPFPAGQILFEKRITRGEWYTIISTFDDKIYMRKHRFHLVEAGFVVTQKV